jgi:hypothetical protein
MTRAALTARYQVTLRLRGHTYQNQRHCGNATPQATVTERIAMARQLLFRCGDKKAVDN